MYRLFTVALFFCLYISSSWSQSLDHWETAVYNDDLWRYRLGTNEPPGAWMQSSFNDQQWSLGRGGLGYGDGDDNTSIPNTLSVYMRHSFELKDTANIAYAILHADYDDAFVAYLNGFEIARNNIGVIGQPPAYNEAADDYHEASLYQGEKPEGYALFGQTLKSRIKEGENVLAIQVHNHNINSSDLSSNFFLSLGISNSSMDYRDPPSWFVPPLLTFDLPLILIRTTETDEIFDEPRVAAHMEIIDNGPGKINSIFDQPNNYDGQIAIEIRGASSQMFPKKNYGFETQDAAGENNNVALLGMPKENDWVLHGPYSDKTLLRNVLAYHMGTVTGEYTPRTRLCELIINEDYRGVYVLTERIKQDKNRVDIARLTPEDIDGDELTGGYIVQIDRDNESIDEDGWYSNFPGDKFYAYHDPDYDRLLPVQRAYIREYIDRFEQAIDNPQYQSFYYNYVDVESWINYFLITEVGKHIDAFKLSFYMHKKKESNGGKLHFGPLWDFNLGFGNFDFDCSPAPEGWSYRFGGVCHDWHSFWVAKLTDIPQVSHQTNCRWKELRAGPLHTDSLLQFIDEKNSLLSEARKRNFDRWPIIGEDIWPNDFVGQSYEEELNFLRDWLTTRLKWMDDNMIGDCDLILTNEEVPSAVQLNLYPTPAQEQITVGVEGPASYPLTLSLYDLLGHLIEEYSISSPQSELSIKEISDGMYFYSVRDKNSLVLKEGKMMKNGE